MTTTNKLAEALRAVLNRDERNTCSHEETHRGGVLWTICNSCGAKWADDEGGMPEWQDPPEWEQAREALAALEAKPADTEFIDGDCVIAWATEPKRASPAAPAAPAPQLPPMPEPHWPRYYQGSVPPGAFTADQMQAYARAAIEASEGGNHG
jgi:hypothetical protein